MPTLKLDSAPVIKVTLPYQEANIVRMEGRQLVLDDGSKLEFNVADDCWYHIDAKSPVGAPGVPGPEGLQDGPGPAGLAPEDDNGQDPSGFFKS